MIYCHRYTLRSGAALNSASVRKAFPGALIHVDGGYAALHPWPEFGDADIDQQLQILRDGGSTPLIQRALHCAQLDGDARRQGVSLFANLTLPRSHYSWSSGQSTGEQLQRLADWGFTAIKAKGYANYGETRAFLDSVAKALPELRLRVDFNGCLDRFAFQKFIEFMPLRVYRQLDLIEDPVPYAGELWQSFRDKWGVRLALDKGWQRGGEGGLDAVVIKPARRDWRVVTAHLPNVPMVLTSAMDHGLGQVYAAYEAALAMAEQPQLIDLCGLVTHHLFEPDPFFDRLHVIDGVLQIDRTGTGLGFDAELAALPWTRLT
jgi:o-succinylbenzoate synthase